MKPLNTLYFLPIILFAASAGLLLAGCSTTVATLNPSPQKPVCERESSALVIWETQWRQNQKDIAEREFAAETGLRQFLVQSGCFAHSELRRINMNDLEPLKGSVDTFDKVISITVREIGPIVMLFSTDGMIEGGTEVVLNITEYALPDFNSKRQFSVNWFSGGAFVIKGVESLPNDMQEALRIGMKPDGGSSGRSF
ncbi:MAG: hypothetical protein AB1717_05065 [Pseudomonadota bacterium]